MNEFQNAVKKLGIKSNELESEAIRDRVQQYCVLLWLKNQHLNLTRHTDWETFVSRDLIDTLELSKLIEPGLEVLDVGSGGGVPGLLLAILRPDLEVNLTESVGKRAKALQEFADSLSMEVPIHHERAEKLLADFRYDVVTARAVGSISKLATLFAGYWPNAGRVLATKGPNWIREKHEAVDAGLLNDVELVVRAEYPTPGTDWSSTIIQLTAKRAPH